MKKLFIALLLIAVFTAQAYASDNTPPTTTATVSWTGIPNASDANITLSCTDAEKDCAITIYSFDGFNWQNYILPILVSNAGTHELQYHSIDKNRNVEAIKEITVIIDKTLPTITNQTPEAGTYTNDSTPEVCATVSDSGSGISAITIIINGNIVLLTGPTANGEYCASQPTPLANNTDVNAVVYAMDTALNFAYSSAVFTIDLDKPAQITDLSAAAGSIELDWSQSTDSTSAIDYYSIYRSTSPITESNKEGNLLANTSQSHYTDYTAIEGIEYYYRVTASDLAGNESLLSNEVRETDPEEPDATLEPQHSSASLSGNDSIGVQFTLKNISGERKCFSFSAQTGSLYVEASPAIASTCLNHNESTNITLNIRTIDAPKGNYTAALSAEFGGSTVSANVNVTVSGGSSQDVELIPFEGEVCRNEEEYFSVLVKNNSGRMQDIRLWADNEILLPYFSPQEITLESGRQRYVKVYVYTGRNTLLEEYRISLFAEYGSQQTKETAYIDVKDCSGEEVDFTLGMGAGCSYAEKGEEERITYTVRNLGEEELELRVLVESGLDAEYDREIDLEEDERKTFSIYVAPDESDDTGRHDLTVTVWNRETGKTLKKTKCIYVREKTAGEARLLKNNLSIGQGSSGVFTLLAKNIGDTELDFRARVLEGFDSGKINVSISEKDFELDSMEQRYVYIATSTMGTTPIGSYEFDVQVRWNGETFTETLKFRVVESQPQPQPSAQGIEIVSFPVQAKAAQGGETTIVVELKNTTGNSIEAGLQLLGLPSGISYTQAGTVSIGPGQTMELELKIAVGNAATGIHKATLAATAGELTATEEIEIFVEEADAGAELLAGLFVAAGNALLGLLVLIMAIALIVLISKALRGNSSRKGRHTEAWLGRGLK